MSTATLERAARRRVGELMTRYAIAPWSAQAEALVDVAGGVNAARLAMRGRSVHPGVDDLIAYALPTMVDVNASPLVDEVAEALLPLQVGSLSDLVRGSVADGEPLFGDDTDAVTAWLDSELSAVVS